MKRTGNDTQTTSKELWAESNDSAPSDSTKVCNNLSDCNSICTELELILKHGGVKILASVRLYPQVNIRWINCWYRKAIAHHEVETCHPNQSVRYCITEQVRSLTWVLGRWAWASIASEQSFLLGWISFQYRHPFGAFPCGVGKLVSLGDRDGRWWEVLEGKLYKSFIQRNDTVNNYSST
jgi:hypothetical protein